ncbi:flagellar export chaperone FliS [Candidatus Nitrospira nitrificans]|uniref:Flagellar secretion chaperone FliS n=1 Tax=Candidatus Nitrospira nitrificans TaxID=1742973 RepID=A0A0S4L1I3_9BACT|nr:flagellar export chaperone FliS [Candidatus Nitrospira nitrificans]CUS31516.1 Flagellin-specific chaperone FliS [Candidatus Nitrospira nitrificans]
MLTQYTNQYKQTQVMTSSRVQIVVLLYDAAIQSIELARTGIESNDPKEKGRFLGRAISIIGELNSVLDFEQGGEIARSLHRLYEYMLSELVMANARNDVRRLDGPHRCLTTLREGWREIAAQQTHPAGVR